MSWATGLQITGIIVTTLGTLLAIESLWRLRLQRTIKLIEDESNKFGIDLAVQIVLRVIFHKIGDVVKKEIGLQAYKQLQITRREMLKIIVYILVLKFFEFVQNVLKKINKHLIGIGVSLIIVGVSIQIFGILIF